MDEETVNDMNSPRESKLSCDKCGDSFKTVGLMRRHMKMYHKNISS